MANFIERREAQRSELLRFMGLRLVEVGDEVARSEMALGPNVASRLGGGGFIAAALVAMVDPTASALCSYASNPTAEPGVPGAVLAQLNAHLVRNTDRGAAHCEARWVHKGRTTMVVESTVRDDDGRVLVLATSTHVTATRPPP